MIKWCTFLVSDIKRGLEILHSDFRALESRNICIKSLPSITARESQKSSTIRWCMMITWRDVSRNVLKTSWYMSWTESLKNTSGSIALATHAHYPKSSIYYRRLSRATLALRVIWLHEFSKRLNSARYQLRNNSIILWKLLFYGRRQPSFPKKNVWQKRSFG